MKTLGYYNGKFDEIENMSIPMSDRVCFFGDGVYDATCCHNKVIYSLDEHVDRFFNSMGLLKIDLGMTKQQVKDTLNEMVSKMDSGDLFVYWQATRGSGPRNHVFPEGQKANFWITLTEQKVKDLSESVKLCTMEDVRFHLCNIKTLNLIPSCLAAQKAHENDCYETVFHRGERVTECAHSNVSIIKDGVFQTAPTDEYILPGIARAHLIKTCRKLGIPTLEKAFTLDELFNADEVIVSASSVFCLPASEIDGKKVGGKAPELLKAIQDDLIEDFLRETEGK